MFDKVLSATIVIALVTTGAFIYASYSRIPELTERLPHQIVPADQIVSGGPPPDGIPSIDNPKFVGAVNASAWLSDDYDPVIGFDLNGDVCAYPFQIMVWHEIVNDMVGGVPVAITYCPLCYAT